MKIIKKIKELIHGKEEETHGVPRERQKVKWKENTNKLGLKGDMAKEIKINSRDRVVPYSKHYLEARKENFSSPVLDTTEGRESPKVNIEKEINPAKLVWEEEE